MKLIHILGALVLVAGLGFGIAWLSTAPEGPAEESVSAARLAGGPHPVGRVDPTFVDPSRPTSPNGDYAGADSRTLEAAVWFPEGTTVPHPLVIYSHGFMSTRDGGAYMAEHLASHGYVVASVDFPLTHFSAPGGPNVADVANQPADVSFLIDQLLEWAAAERPFSGPLDPERVGVFGLSLGGLTTTLSTFHPRLRDSRVKAAVSIAGPTVLFSRDFFRTVDVPFLMIAGTSDAMVDYEANAAPVPGWVATGGLLALRGGSHAGFDQTGAGVMRLLGNPDSLGCRALTGNLAPEEGENPFPNLGGPEDGVLENPDSPMPCQTPPPADALHAGRQHMMTRLAVHAFFESQLASDPSERRDHAAFLATTLSGDFPEARFWPAGG